MRSWGLRKTRCSASVNSTTPRLGPRWPPVLDTVATRNWRISSASARSSGSLSERRSAGLVIRSSTGVVDTSSMFRCSSLAKSRRALGRMQRGSTRFGFCRIDGTREIAYHAAGHSVWRKAALAHDYTAGIPNQEHDANPYGVLAAGGGSYVADAGSNTLNFVSNGSHIRILHYFPSATTPGFPPMRCPPAS